jgi:hypothetical protein
MLATGMGGAKTEMAFAEKAFSDGRESLSAFAA